MPKLKHTVLLLVLLVTPFLIKLYFGGIMEVYPSITLPAFPTLLNAESGEITYKYQKLYVETDGEWILLDQAKMFYPLQHKFYDIVIGKEFGLKDKEGHGDRKLFTVLRNINLIKNRQLSTKDKQEAIEWLNSRLNRINVYGNKIKIVEIQKTSNLDAVLLNEEIVNEEIIKLF